MKPLERGTGRNITVYDYETHVISNFSSVHQFLYSINSKHRLPGDQWKKLNERYFCVLKNRYFVFLSFAFSMDKITEYLQNIYEKDFKFLFEIEYRNSCNDDRTIFILNPGNGFLSIKYKFIGGPVAFAKKYNLRKDTVKSQLSRFLSRIDFYEDHQKHKKNTFGVYCYKKDYQTYLDRYKGRKCLCESPRPGIGEYPENMCGNCCNIINLSVY